MVKTMGAEKYPSDRDQLKEWVLIRDDYECQECGRQDGRYQSTEFTVRQIIPPSRGGSHHPRNLLTLCSQCRDQFSEHHRLGSGDRIKLWRPQNAPEQSTSREIRVHRLAGGLGMPVLLTFLFLLL